MMKKHLFTFVVLLVLLLACTLTVFAHSGGTDENGGHYDSTTGEYHYHHGWPAHDHNGGECPYDFVDNVDHDRDNSSDDSYSSAPTEHSDYNDSKKPRLTWWQILLAIVSISLWIVPFFLCVIAPSLTKENILNALSFIAFLVAILSPIVFFFSLIFLLVDGGSSHLYIAIGISGGIMLITIVTLKIINRRR